MKSAEVPSAKPEGKPKEITGAGSVIDADTGQPIEGAKVTAWIYDVNNENGTPFKYLQHVDAVSDAAGKYRVTISTDLAQTLSDDRTAIGIEITAKHSEYVALSSYPRLTFIFDSLRPAGFLTGPGISVTDEPNHDLPPIEMIPAKQSTGVLQSSDGKPAAGVRIWAYPTAADRADGKRSTFAIGPNGGSKRRGSSGRILTTALRKEMK